MINCLIIDDEPLARERVFNLVSKNKDLNFIGEAGTGRSAIKLINELKPNLVFLDIQMKDMTGFNVLKSIKEPPIVIFITAYDEYAIKAFDHFAFDYLLKPFKKERFDLAVERVVEYIKSNNQSMFKNKLDSLLDNLQGVDLIGGSRNSSSTNKKLAVKIGKTVSFISINAIKYILASGSYVDIKTVDKSLTLRSSLDTVLEDINDVKFVRIHRSTIINTDYIDKLIYSNYGEIDTKMTDGNLFRVSKTYKKEYLKLLGV